MTLYEWITHHFPGVSSLFQDGKSMYYLREQEYSIVDGVVRTYYPVDGYTCYFKLSKGVKLVHNPYEAAVTHMGQKEYWFEGSRYDYSVWKDIPEVMLHQQLKDVYKGEEL